MQISIPNVVLATLYAGSANPPIITAGIFRSPAISKIT